MGIPAKGTLHWAAPVKVVVNGPRLIRKVGTMVRTKVLILRDRENATASSVVEDEETSKEGGKEGRKQEINGTL